VQRFPGHSILSVSGIRREESATRSNAPVAKDQPRLTNRGKRTTGLDWHPLLDWRLSDVLSYLDEKNWPLHEAYTTYGCSRVSCIFCVLASRADLRAASTCEDNMDVYGKLVRLETDSTFAFQESHWLGDVAPHILDSDLRDALACAKRGAQVREAAEAGIPNHLLYENGIPRTIPNTNQVESYHGFSKWLSFGGEGIAENEADEQQKCIRYNDLLASAVILQNVIDMTKIIGDLRREGWTITDEDLTFLSPYLTLGLKRFGDYMMDLDREIEPTIRELLSRRNPPVRGLAKEA